VTVIVFGVMKDKDYTKMARFLKAENREIILTRPDIERAENPEVLQEKFGFGKVVRKVTDAVTEAKKLAGADGLVVVAGSFHTIAEIY